MHDELQERIKETETTNASIDAEPYGLSRAQAMENSRATLRLLQTFVDEEEPSDPTKASPLGASFKNLFRVMEQSELEKAVQQLQGMATE